MTIKLESRFGLLRVCCFLALRFQLSELLCRKDTLRVAEERLPALLSTAGLHAISLPRFDFGLLIWRQIERCQINA